MLRGDLKTTPLSDLLKRLADAKATGCVYVQPGSRRSLEATVALREGAIGNVTIPGTEDAVGARLVANRRLTPAELAEAREAQETELATWTLAELLIHLGLADEQEVEALVLEQALASLTELCEWSSGSWRFRRRERTGPSLPTPLEVADALARVAERQAQWLDLQATVHGADAIVSLAAHPENPQSDPNLEMDADSFALLCAVDGSRTLSELAGSAGFTLLDAARKVAALVESGLVQVAHPSDDDQDDELSEADDPHGDGADGTGDGSRSLDAIAAAFSFDGPSAADLEVGLSPVGAPWQPPRTAQGDTLADALARVSAALSDAMTEQEQPADDGPETVEVVEVVEVVEAVEALAVVEVVEAEAEVAEVEVEAEPEVEVEVEAEAEIEPVVAEGDEYLAAIITLPFAAEDSTPYDEHAEAAVETVEIPDPVEAVDTVEIEEPEPVEAELDEAPIDELDELVVEDDEAPLIEEDAAEHLAAEPEAEAEPQAEPEAELIPEESFDADADAADAEATEPEVEVAVAVAETEAEAEAAPEPVFEPEHMEQAAHVETAHESRASAANAARLLSQFSEESVTRRPEPEPEPEPEAPPAAPEGHAPRPRRENGLADTAALLRELSGLTTETTTSAPRMPNRPTPSPVASAGGQHARKRKGLFGRS